MSALLSSRYRKRFERTTAIGKFHGFAYRRASQGTEGLQPLGPEPGSYFFLAIAKFLGQYAAREATKNKLKIVHTY